jgi:hypothetical protein
MRGILWHARPLARSPARPLARSALPVPCVAGRETTGRGRALRSGQGSERALGKRGARTGRIPCPGRPS